MFAQNIFTHALALLFCYFMPTLDVIFKNNFIFYFVLCFYHTL